MESRHRRFLGGNAKTLVIVLIATSLVIAYALHSRHEWNQFEATYRSSFADATTHLDAALQQPSSTPQESAARHGELRAWSESANRVMPCAPPSPSGAWQQVFSSQRDALRNCQDLARRLDDIAIALRPLTSFEASDQEFLILFEAVATIPSDPPESEWLAIAQQWQILDDDLTSFPAASSYEPVLTVARDGVHTISLSWQNVLAAHESNDKPVFDVARADLVTSYEALEQIAAQRAATHAKIQDEFTETYTSQNR